jgi:hypothetical protein
LEFKPPYEHWVVPGLAGMTCDRPVLAGAVKHYREVQLTVSSPDKDATELIAQGPRHTLGQGPGEHGQTAGG